MGSCFASCLDYLDQSAFGFLNEFDEQYLKQTIELDDDFPKRQISFRVAFFLIQTVEHSGFFEDLIFSHLSRL